MVVSVLCSTLYMFTGKLCLYIIYIRYREKICELSGLFFEGVGGEELFCFSELCGFSSTYSMMCRSVAVPVL